MPWQSASVQHVAPVSSHGGHLLPPQFSCVSFPSITSLTHSSPEGEREGDADGLVLGLPEGDADGDVGHADGCSSRAGVCWL